MIIAVDTGGTKTLVTGFDRQGQPGHEHRFETPQDQDAYTSELLALLDEHYKEDEIDALSVAVPGFVQDGVVAWCGNLPWKNFDLKKALNARYKCPVLIENDANLAGLSEANALEPIPPVTLYLTISTGIGGGLVVDGKLHPRLSRLEPGHMMLEFDGRVREWEHFASGRAIYDTFGKKAHDIEDPKLWDKIASRFATGLLQIIPLFQPDVIIIGGSLGTHFQHYQHRLKAILDDQLPDYLIRSPIIQAKHPQEAVLYGCYYHAVHSTQG